MSNIYDFMGEHPFLTWFLAMILAGCFKTPFILAKRYLRSRDIRARGWPPAHCDADGDFKPEKNA